MNSSFRTSVMPLNEEASLGILKHLNKDELQKLLDDENKLEELIYDDQQVSTYCLDFIKHLFSSYARNYVQISSYSSSAL